MTMGRSILPQIMMIENNPADVLLTKLAMKSSGIEADFIVFETIEDGLDHLEDAPLPKLVLLDLNLFGEGGITFLKLIRQNPRFDKLKVSVLTTSASDKDRETCLSLGATYFIVKSMMFEDFIKSLDVLKPIFSLQTA